ncbi:MAG: Rne/Rng family ribonuclease [Elusimicrobia bacterium]|jgi:ribonuclease G|nr:Rne/Rng family ribonuclease [Elusimicrobiota bacterium]
MSKKIYADITEDENRIAIVEKGRLIDLHIMRYSDQNRVGNIYSGVVQNVLKNINACFVDIGTGKNVFLPISDYKGNIKKGKKVLIQVAKEEVQEKGAKVTGKISLSGRHIVYMPKEGKIGVSRNIKDKKERKRLRSLLAAAASNGEGFVARTNAENLKKRTIMREVKYLRQEWKGIEKSNNKAKRNQKPVILHNEANLVIYAAREFLDSDTLVFIINDKKQYKEVKTFIKKTDPSLKNKIELYKSDMPIFERYKIESQIDNLKKRTISLDCGGYIIIEQTEALTAIDVNTGSYTKGSNREKTAMKVNSEAARLATSQIILRDLGGIIIIDFIDLKTKKNRNKLLSIMHQEMKIDKASLKIFPMSRLGLIEMTRQRRKESIIKILGQDCPYCSGSGIIFSETTMYIKIKRELIRKGPKIRSKYINLFLHPRVAEEFDSKGLQNIEKQIKKKIKLRRDYKLHHEDFKITA